MAIENKSAATDLILTQLSGKSLAERNNIQSARRRAERNPGGLPETLEDYALLNPNASNDQLRQFQIDRRNLETERMRQDLLGQEVADKREGRGVLGTLQDAGASTLSGINSLSQATYGALDLASQFSPAGYLYSELTGKEAPTLDSLVKDVTGNSMYQGYDLLEKGTQGIKTDRSQYEDMVIQRDADYQNKKLDEELDAKIKSGGSKTWNEVKRFAGKVANTVDAYTAQPTKILEEVTAEMPSMLAGGSLGKLLTSKALKNKSPDEVIQYLSTKQGQKRLDAIGEKAGIVTGALEEGISSAAQSKVGILNTEFDTLYDNSPAYRQMVDEQGMSPEEARQELADKGFVYNAVANTLLSGLISKATGAGKLEGNFLRGKQIPTDAGDSVGKEAASRIGKLVQKGSQALGSIPGVKGLTEVTKDVLRESTEEGVQGFTQGVTSNLISSQLEDENVGALDGVAEQVGQGIAVGGGVGGTLSTIKNSPTAAKEARQVVRKAIGKANEAKAKRQASLRGGDPAYVEAVGDKELAKKLKNGEDVEEYINTESESYSPYKALQVLTNPTYIPMATEVPEGATDKEKEILKLKDDIRRTQWMEDVSRHIEPLRERATEASAELDDHNRILRIEEENKQIQEYNANLPKGEEPKEEVPLPENAEEMRLSSERVDELESIVETFRSNEQATSKIFTIMEEEDEQALNDVVEKLTTTKDGNTSDEETRLLNILGSTSLGEKELVAVSKVEKALENPNISEDTKEKLSQYVARFKSSNEVSDEIFQGTKENMGVKDHLANVGSAVKSGNTQSISRAMSWFKRLRDNQVEKANVLESAQQRFNETGQPQRVTTSTGSTYTVDGKSGNFINKVRQEANAVSNTYNRAGQRLQERGIDVSGMDVGTPVTPQAPSQTQSQQEQAQQQNNVAPSTSDTRPSETSQGDVSSKAVENEVQGDNQQEETVSEASSEEESQSEEPSETQTSTQEEVSETPTENQANAGTSNNNQGQQQEARPKQVAKPKKEKKGSAVRRDYTKDWLKNITPDKRDELLNRAKSDGLYDSLNKFLLSAEVSEESPLFDKLEGEEEIQTPSDDRPTRTKKVGAVDLFMEIAKYYMPSGTSSAIIKQLANSVAGVFQERVKIKPKNNPLASETPLFEQEGIGELVRLKPLYDSFIAGLDKSLKGLDTNPNNLKFQNLLNLTADGAKFQRDLDNGNVQSIAEYVPEKVLEGLFIAGVSELASGGNTELRDLSESDVRFALDLRKEDEVTPEMYALVGTAGSNYQIKANSIGKTAKRILGFSANSDALLGTEDAISLTLGSAILQAFTEMTIGGVPIGENVKVSNRLLNRLYAELSNVNEEEALVTGKGDTTYTNFYKVTAEGNSLISGSFGSAVSEELDTLFSIDNGGSFPKSKPIKKIPETNSAGKTLSKTLKKGVKRMQKTAFQYNTSVLRMYELLGKEAVMEADGYVSDMRKVVQDRLMSVEGKNEDLERQWDNMMGEDGHVNSLKDKSSKFYFGVEVKSNDRAHIKDKIINYQNYKLQRHAMVSENWVKEVETQQDRDLFWFAVAQGLGIDIDKIPFEESIAQAKEMYNDAYGPVAKAVRVVRKYDSNPRLTEMSEEDRKTFMAGVSQGTLGIQALVELAKYKENEPFTTNISVEIDGITNGTAWALLMMGLPVNWTVDELEKVGVYEYEGGAFSYARKRGLNDVYETVMDKISEWLSDVPEKSFFANHPERAINTAKALGSFLSKKGMTPIEEIGGDFNLNRSIAKPPVMTGNYGAGAKKQKQNVSNEVYNSVLTQLNNILSAKIDLIDNARETGAVDKEQRAKVRNELNLFNESMEILYQQGGGDFTWTPLSLNNIQDFKFSSDEVSYIKEVASSTIGELVVGAYSIYMEPVKAARMAINNQINTISHFFIGVYQSKLEERRQAKGYVTEGDAQEIMEELTPILPKIAIPSSNGSKDTFYLALEEMRVPVSKGNGAGNKGFEISLKTEPTPYPLITQDGTISQTRPVGSINMKVGEPGYKDSGVKFLVNAIQSADSSGIMSALSLDDETPDIMNVFDAYITGLDGVVKMGKNINRQFHSISRNYSVYESVTNMRQDVLETARKTLPKELYTAGYESALSYVNNEALKYVDMGYDSLDTFFDDFDVGAKKATENKNKTFQRISRVSQYNLEGHDNYIVPEQYRKVDKELPKITNDFETFEKVFEQSAHEVEGSVEDLGSTVKSSGLAKFREDQAKEFELNADNPVALLNMLANKSGGMAIDPDHLKYLKNLLGKAYNEFINPVKVLIDSASNKEAWGSYDPTRAETRVMLNTGSVQSGIEMSAPEVFAHETVHAITFAALNGGNKNVSTLKSLYRSVANKLDHTIFMKNGLNEKEAKERFDYIFNNKDKTAEGFSKGLMEFVAFGLTNKDLMQALEGVTFKLPNKPRTNYLSKLFGIFSDFIKSLLDKFNKNSIESMSGDKVLQKLVYDLVKAETRSKLSVFSDALNDKSTEIEKSITNTISNYVREPLIKVLSKPNPVRNVPYVGPLVGMFQKNSVIFLNNNMEDYKTAMNQLMRRMGMTHKNLITSVVNEVSAPTKDVQWAHEKLRRSKHILDQTRKDLMTNIQQHVKKQFSRALTDEEENALTKVMLRTDMASLVGTIPPAELYTLLFQPGALNSEIAKRTKGLKTFKQDFKWYRDMSDNLAHFMVKEKSLYSFQLLNARAIADRIGTGLQAPSKKHSDTATKAIDVLATLKAIKLTAETYPDEFNTFKKVYEEEYRSDAKDNGITFTLMNEADAKQRDLEGIFQGQEYLMQKGYVKDVYNPNQDLIAAPLTDRETLEKDGYKLLNPDNPKPIGTDGDDPIGVSNYLYISNNAAQATFQSAGISIANMNSKGTNYQRVLTQASDADTASTLAPLALANIKNAKQGAAMSLYRGEKPKSKGNTLVPTLNGKGEISDFRYMMARETKENYLDVNSKLSRVVAARDGNSYSKQVGGDNNKEYIDALYEDFKADYLKDPDRYVVVSASSSDPELRGFWDNAPSDMKRYAEKKFGKGAGIPVKRDILYTVFGQRKFSLNAWGKDRKAREQGTKTVANVLMNHVAKALGSNMFGKVENGWMEIVAWVKDTIVIKSVDTLLGNITSNQVLLWSMGMSHSEIVRKQVEAINKAQAYEEDLGRVREIEREIKYYNKLNKPEKVKELELEKVDLEDSLNRNPIKPLMDEGIYQSIVEDVEDINNDFSMQNQLESWIGSKTERVPEILKDVGREAALTRESEVYKLLRRSTQLSDFTARYALHTFNLANGMSVNDSYNKIEDTFVNYDLATHKGIQYLNDVGGVFFTKFLFRIQRVIWATLTERPARFFMSLITQNVLGDIADIADSFLFLQDLSFKFNSNPLSVLEGAFDTHPILNVVE